MPFSFIFDMDGTLFQTHKILEISLEETFNYLRDLDLWESSTPVEAYRRIMGVPLPKVWETLLPDHSKDVREDADKFFQEQLIGAIKSGKGSLYPHAENLFSFLKEKGCSIFIASNGLADYLKAIENYYNLDQWITETFSIEQINSLDKAELVGTLLTKYKLTKAAVVGDRLSDIQAAKSNGLVAIGCRFDFAREEELSHADFVVDDLLELKEIFSQIEVPPYSPGGDDMLKAF
jgi:phosphoglycolate phosphatase-like HAD superfamily hydrolase